MSKVSNVEVAILSPFILLGFLFEGMRVGFATGRILYGWLARRRHV